MRKLSEAREIARCPKCSGVAIMSRVLKDGNIATFQATCMKCGHGWEEQFIIDKKEGP